MMEAPRRIEGPALHSEFRRIFAESQKIERVPEELFAQPAPALTVTHMAPEQKTYPYGAIVVMPYSSDPLEGGGFGLSLESEFAARAAIQAYKENKSNKIIVVGERTYGDKTKTLSTDQFMKDIFIRFGVPASAIETHSRQNNSALQLAQVKRAHSAAEKPFLVLSLAFHQQRVERITERFKIPADHATVEGLLLRADPRYKEILAAWEPSAQKFIKGERLVNFLDRFWLGRLCMNFVTHLRGPRSPMTSGPRPSLPVVRV